MSRSLSSLALVCAVSFTFGCSAQSGGAAKGGASGSAGQGAGGDAGSGAGGFGNSNSGGGLNVDASVGGSGGDSDNPETCDEARAQRSYIGCDFWPTVTFNPVYTNFDFAVVVANGGKETAEVSVTRGGNSVTSVSVAAGTLASIPLPWVDELKGPMFDAQTTGGRVNQSVLARAAAYHLTSTAPITAWQFNPLEYEKPMSSCPVTPTYGDGTRCLSVSNDAALLLPASAMTGSYRLFGRSAVNGGDAWGSTPGSYAITATEAGTQVKVQLSAATASGSGVGAGSAGQTLTFDLEQGDVLELLGAWGAFWDEPHADLSGSVVIANHPVQVIASNALSSVPNETAGYADHLEEVVLPGEVLGDDYLVAPPSAPDGRVVGHLVRLYGNVDGTQLSYPGSTPPSGAPTSINAGQVVELGPLSEAFRVSGSQPFGVGSFMLGGTLQDPSGNDVETRGDPAFSVLVTPKQFRRQYTFLAPADYLENYADILLEEGTQITLDGNALSASPVAIGTTGWSVVRVRLDATGAGAHRLESDRPVGLQVMGFGHATSYYYPGGLNLELISEPPVIK